jgi:protein-tyrosine phosphatase
MKPDLFWIPGPWRGKLAVSTRPRGGDWLEDEVTGWRDAGLDTVVSLLERDEAVQLELADERNVIQSKGLQFLWFPIPDRGVPASTGDTLKFLTEITAELAAGRNVAIHCRQGIGRSGLLAAASLVTAGMGVREAVDVVSKARGVAVPETSSQLQWLKNLASEHLVVAPLIKT